MEAAYISALSALAGSALGAFSSLATIWMTQHTQSRLAYLNQQRAKREALYSEFIDEASRLFTDALSHEMEDISKVVHLYSFWIYQAVEIASRTLRMLPACAFHPAPPGIHIA